MLAKAWKTKIEELPPVQRKALRKCLLHWELNYRSWSHVVFDRRVLRRLAVAGFITMPQVDRSATPGWAYRVARPLHKSFDIDSDELLELLKPKRPTLQTWTVTHASLCVTIELRAGKREYQMRATAAVPGCEKHPICPVSAGGSIDPEPFRSTGANRAAIISVLTTLVMRDLVEKLEEYRGPDDDPDEADAKSRKLKVMN